MRRALATAALGLLVFAPFAHAGYDPLSSGVTRLTLDKGLLSLLKQNRIRLAAVAPAKSSARVVSFPVSGGKFDPTSSSGTIEHDGALVFEAAGGSLPLKSLRLKTDAKRSPFSVKAGGGQLKLATAAGLVVSRRGFGDKVEVNSLSLSAKVATRLEKKLHLDGIFEAGQPLGSTVTRAQPRTVTVLGQGRATLTLDPQISAKLASLFVAVNPIFPAEHIGPVFTLPIFGGTIAPDARLGRIETSGAIELLQLGGGQVFWSEDWLDLGTGTASPIVDVEPAPPYAGKVDRVPIGGLGLSAAAISSNQRRRTVTVSGATLSLADSTAAIFNEVFAEPQGEEGVFAAGEPLGTISFTAQGQ